MQGTASLAVALAPLSTTTRGGGVFPQRILVMFLTLAVILVTFAGQGLALIRRPDLGDGGADAGGRDTGTAGDQVRTAIRAGLTDWGRNRVLWLLLAAVPAVFIVFATALAPGSKVRLSLDENGRQVTRWSTWPSAPASTPRSWPR